jgi:TRAP-type mannitol/chloroaromatic compound transport system substrate-binding protein
MRSSSIRATSAALAGVLSLALAGGAAAQQAITWNMQSGYVPTLSVIGESAKRFTDLLAKASNGTITLRYLDPGVMVPPPQIFDAVASGRIETGYGWPGFQAGKMPAANLFGSVPFGPDPVTYMAWMHEGGGMQLWRELYAPHNVVPHACGVLPAEASGWFRKPVQKLEDLRGMKIRYAGLGGEVLKKFGVSPTMTPAGEIFMNLERGVIDATEFSLPSIDRGLGFYKVAKHYYFPGWHQPGTFIEFLVHKPRWDALTDSQRALVEAVCGDSARWTLARSLGAQAEAMAFFKEQGITIHVWSPAMLAAFRKASDEVLAEQAAKDATFKKVLDSLTAFRKRVAVWSDIAVPR